MGNGKTTAKRPVGRPPNKPAAEPVKKDDDMAVGTEAGFSIRKVALDKVTFAKAATLGEAGSKYDPLVEALSGMQPGDPAVILAPDEGEDARTLRNRITGPVRKKAQPLAGGKLRIRLTTEPADHVAIVCEPWPAEAEAAE